MPGLADSPLTWLITLVLLAPEISTLSRPEKMRKLVWTEAPVRFSNQLTEFGKLKRLKQVEMQAAWPQTVDMLMNSHGEGSLTGHHCLG